MTAQANGIIGRCATCRFAEPGSSAGERYPLTCRRAEGRDGKPKNERTLAFADDTDAYHARLNVSPDFGCVQYEARS